MKRATYVERLIASVMLFSAGVGGCWGDGNSPHPGAPGQAAAAGYSRLDLDEDFSKFQLSPDGKGDYTWYRGLWQERDLPPLSHIVTAEQGLTLAWKRGQALPDTSIATYAPDLSRGRTWKYGYFEAEMRWTPQIGAWPAFWLFSLAHMQGRDGDPPKWGEIDIFEGQGSAPTTFYGTVHEHEQRHHVQNRFNRVSLPLVDFSQWHIYGALWVPGRVSWYFDNRLLFSAQTYQSDDEQEMVVILGSQAGVNFTYGNLKGVTTSEIDLDVAWVRVWQP